ncbi:MAG TPA: carboxypeptidase-like regulatory domain-containing protein [Candidatus Lokiarchaeia archaeon]|nr:carboxypeptidase-like regulatory domain-containing protein [Candidatus Lokiarchaeia archaeon]
MTHARVLKHRVPDHAHELPAGTAGARSSCTRGGTWLRSQAIAPPRKSAGGVLLGRLHLDAYTSYDNVLADSVCRYPATVNITREPTALSFLPASQAGLEVQIPFNQTTQVAAQLTGLNNRMLGGEPVDFYLPASTGNYLGTAYTTAQGFASLSFATTLTPGDYSIEAQFAGDNVSAPAAASQQVAISKTSAAITFMPTEVPFGAPLALTGHVFDAATGAPVSGAAVKFALLQNNNILTSLTVTTDASGTANGVLANLKALLVPGTYNVTENAPTFFYRSNDDG